MSSMLIAWIGTERRFEGRFTPDLDRGEEGMMPSLTACLKTFDRTRITEDRIPFPAAA
jgi:hypothetical protein